MATIATTIWPRSCRSSYCESPSPRSDTIKGSTQRGNSSIQRRRREPMVAQRGSAGKKMRDKGSAGGATLVEDVFWIKSNSMFLQKPDEFIFKRHLPMMLLLAPDITFHCRIIRRAHTECRIPLLPGKPPAQL